MKKKVLLIIGAALLIFLVFVAMEYFNMKRHLKGNSSVMESLE